MRTVNNLTQIEAIKKNIKIEAVRYTRMTLDRCVIIKPCAGKSRMLSLLPKGQAVPDGFIRVYSINKRPVFFDGKLHNRFKDLPLYSEGLYQ
jgi:hypothetical protein